MADCRSGTPSQKETVQMISLNRFAGRAAPARMLCLVVLAAGMLSACAASARAADPRASAPRAADVGAPAASAPATGVAAPAPAGPGPADTLSLAGAVALALLNNPELQAYSWDIRAAEARSLQAGARPNPELSLDVEGISGGLPGLAESEMTLSLGHLLERGGKRAARRAAADADVVVRSGDYEIARLSVMARVTRAFLDVSASSMARELQEADVEIAGEIRASIGRMVAGGAAHRAEQIRADLDYETTRLDLRDLERSESVARVRLSSLWGDVRPRFTAVAGIVDQLQDVPPRDELLARLESGPVMGRMSALIDAAEKERALARAEGAVNLSVSAGYRRLNGDDTGTFVAGLSLPLLFFDRNRGSVAAAAADIERARSERDNLKIERALAFSEALAAAERDRDRWITLRDAVIPAAERAFAEIHAGFERGRFTYVDLLEARRALTRARRDLLATKLDYHRVVADLELLLGAPLIHNTGEK